MLYEVITIKMTLQSVSCWKRVVYEMVHVSEHPLVKHKLTLLRNVQTEPKKFRELIRELAMLLCYEATEDLDLDPVKVQSPMGEADGHLLAEKIGLIPILRAGLGMVEGRITSYNVCYTKLLRLATWNSLPSDSTILIRSRGYIWYRRLWFLEYSLRRSQD